MHQKAQHDMIPSGMKLIYSIDNQPKEFELQDKQEVKIGRSRRCEIRIVQTDISRVHAKILVNGNEAKILDQGSRNGIFINGLRVTEAILKNNDKLGLGGFPLEFVIGEPVTNKPDPTPEPQPQAETSSSPAQPPKKPDAYHEQGPFPIITVLEGASAEPLEMKYPRISLGSNSDNDLTLEGKGISRYHAEISRVDDIWLLRDLRSKGGTVVNDQKVDEKVLQNGDKIRLGSTLLEFKLSGVPAAATQSRAPKAIKLVALIAGAVLILLLGIFGISSLLKSKKNQTTESIITPKNPQQVYQKLLDNGVAKLDQAFEAGDYSLALKNFQKATQIFPEATGFVKLIDFMKTKGRDRIKMPWSEMETLLLEAQAGEHITAQAHKFIESKLIWITQEKPNSHLYADGLAFQAGNELEQALATFSQVQSNSLYYQDIAPRIDQIKAKLMTQYVTRADALIKERKLKEALELLTQAQDLSEILDEAIVYKQAFCQRNIDDAQNFKQAERLFNEEKYPEALHIIRTIDVKSVCYDQAHALKLKIEQDSLTIQVKNTYQQGQGTEALELINDSPISATITTELKELIARITKIIDLYEKGLEALQAKEFGSARVYWETILETETDPANFYYQQATELSKQTPEEIARQLLREASKEITENQDAQTARKKLEQARDLDPTNDQIKYVEQRLSVLLHKLARQDIKDSKNREAYLKLEEAKALDPDNKDAQQELTKLRANIARRYNQIVNAELADEQKIDACKGILEELPEESDLYEIITKRISRMSE